MSTNRIEEADALFAIRDVERLHCVVAFEGLLAPSENYVVPYKRAALEVTGIVQERMKSKNKDYAFRFNGSIHSIDDSGLAFIGPNESKEAAEKRCASFRSFIEKNHPLMPTLEEVSEWGVKNGVYPDFY